MSSRQSQQTTTTVQKPVHKPSTITSNNTDVQVSKKHAVTPDEEDDESSECTEDDVDQRQ